MVLHKLARVSHEDKQAKNYNIAGLKLKVEVLCLIKIN